MDKKIIDADSEQAPKNVYDLITGKKLTEADLAKLKHATEKKQGDWLTPNSRNLEVMQGNGMKPLIPYDRENFHKDVYNLYKARNDPDKLITLLHEFNNIYIWPAVAISLLTFPQAPMLDKAELHESSSTIAVKPLIKISEEFWKNDIARKTVDWMLSLKNLLYLNFNYTHISYIQNDIYEKIFKKNLDPHEFLAELSREVVFYEDLDFDATKFFRPHEPDFSDKNLMTSVIMAPIYSDQQMLKAIVLLSYPRPNVMESNILFDYKCILDLQVLLKVIGLCFT